MSQLREPGKAVSTRGSWSTLIVWAAAITVLAVLGTGIAGRLAPMSLEVPGTPSSRAEAMLRARFGNTIPIAILLKGPPTQVDSQGRRLVSELRGIGRVQVLSPWDQGSAMGSLRPRPSAAFVLVNYNRPADRAMAVVPSAEAILARTVRPPVHTYLTGVAVIGQALQEATMSDTLRAEMIALPVLILVLLLVFRSPVAAAVPLAMGGATVMAGHGLLWLASFVTPINSLGVAIAAMMSLALGVNYALLMVSRVRQQLAEGWDYEDAVAIAAKTAGRTIASAGGTLALTMLAASAVATPGLLGPVAIGVVISGLLSVGLALSAMPALLRVLGPRLNRWEIKLARSPGKKARGGLGALAERLIAHPAVTVPLILAGMMALAAPAGALRMGPPDAAELPASSPARQAVRMVERTIGPGWSAPFVIVASAHEGAITTPARLRALMKWQETIARSAGRRGGARPCFCCERAKQARASPHRNGHRAAALGRRTARDRGSALGIESRRQRRSRTAQRPGLGRGGREIPRRRCRPRRRRGAAPGRRNRTCAHGRAATDSRNESCPCGSEAAGKRNRACPHGREAVGK